MFTKSTKFKNFFKFTAVANEIIVISLKDKEIIVKH